MLDVKIKRSLLVVTVGAVKDLIGSRHAEITNRVFDMGQIARRVMVKR